MKKISLALLAPLLAYAGIEEAEVVSGKVRVETRGNTTEIHAEERTILNCKRLNIGKEETLRFTLPHKKSAILNRVTGEDPSQILGKLESNGRVFLINPNGIVFGKGCEVNTHALIASTLDITDHDFLKDHYRFSGKRGQIENWGSLEAEEGIALLAPNIINEGRVVARSGRVALLSGEAVTLDFTGDGLMGFVLSGELEEGIILQAGSVIAEAGLIALEAKAARRAIVSVINTDGLSIGTELLKEQGVVKIVKGARTEGKEISIRAPTLKLDSDLTAEKRLTLAAEVKSATGFVLKGKDIYPEGPITSNGPLHFRGTVHARDKIGSANQDIVFDGDFKVGEKVTVSSRSQGKGSVHFLGSVESESGEGSLSVISGQGEVFFREGIGRSAPLANLTLDGRLLTLSQIGSKRNPGVTRSFGATAAEAINLTGDVFAETQKWQAPRYAVERGIEIESDGTTIAFERGPIEVKEKGSLKIETHGGALTVIAIKAEGRTPIELISGPLDLGEVVAPLAPLKVSAEQIILRGGTDVKTVQMSAEGDIISTMVSGVKMKASGRIAIDSTEGSLGTDKKRIWIDTPSDAMVGAKKLVYLEGNSLDNILLISRSNIPEAAFFNGIEYHMPAYDFSFEDQLSQKPVHFMAHVKEGAPIDYVVPVGEALRPGSIYYTVRR